MAKKPKRIIFRSGKHEDPNHTSHGKGNSEEKNDEQEITIRERLMESFEKAAPDVLHSFFLDRLNIGNVINVEKAEEAVNSFFTSEKQMNFLYAEWMDYIKAKMESKKPENDVPEEPEDYNDEPEKPDNTFEPKAEEMFQKFEEYARDNLEYMKKKLQEELDRLTVCEARLDQHDKDIEVVNLSHITVKETVDASILKLESKLVKMFEKMRSSTTSESTYTKYKIEYPDKTTKKIDGVMPKEFKKILDLAQARKNVLMIGPSGCGKTHIAPLVAEALGLRFASMSCSAGMDEAIYQGIILPTAKDGRFEFHPSSFVHFYENGGVFLKDEMDLADDNLLAFSNTATSNDYFYLPKRFNNQLVKRHKDFVLLAAMNTFGHGGNILYSARNTLDGATLDRFRSGIVMMDYDPRVEKAIVDPIIYEWGIWIRKAIKALSMNRLLTTRLMKDFTELKVRYDWPIQEFEATYFADWEKDDVKRVKQWILKELEAMKDKLE